jgi:hypothetical protein
MAGVPCVNDTCSIVSTVDENGRLNINARLSALGGLVCGTDALPNDGLRVALHGDPAAVSPASLTECDNLLGITTEGKLFAQRPGYELLQVTGTEVDFPSDATDSTNSTNFTVTNNANCSRLVILRTKFVFQFTSQVQDPGFKTDGTFVLDVSPGYGSESYPFFYGGPGNVDLNGGTPDHVIMSGESGSDIHIVTKLAMDMFTIPASQAIQIRGYGTDRTAYNTADGSGGSNGLTVSHTLLMMDMKAGDLF